MGSIDLRKTIKIESCLSYYHLFFYLDGNGYFGRWGVQHKTIKMPGDVIASENFSGTVMVSEQLVSCYFFFL